MYLHAYSDSLDIRHYLKASEINLFPFCLPKRIQKLLCYLPIPAVLFRKWIQLDLILN